MNNFFSYNFFGRFSGKLAFWRRSAMAFRLVLAVVFFVGQGSYSDASYRLLKRIRFNAIAPPTDFLAHLININPVDGVDNFVIHDPIIQSFPDTDLIVYSAFQSKEVPKSTQLFYRVAGLTDKTYQVTDFVNFSRVDIAQVPSQPGAAI